MIRKLIQSVLCLCLSASLWAQQEQVLGAELAANSQVQSSAGSSASRTVRIPIDTKVALRLEQSISSATSQVGERIRFTLVNDLFVDGKAVAPSGTSCFATVTQVARATLKDPNLVGAVSFSDPKLDLGHGKRLRLTVLDKKGRYDAAHADGGFPSSPLELLALVTAPIWVPFVLLDATMQQAKNRQAQPPPGNDYYVLRTVKIRMDRIVITSPTDKPKAVSTP